MPEPNSGCWLYLGVPGKNGYGAIGIGRRKATAHRASYEAYVGPIPAGMVIRHRCHTKLCVNPAHLSVGTHSENIADSVRNDQTKYRNVSKVDLRDRIEQRSVPEPNSGCWLWTGALAPLGYGEIGVDGRKTLAHRAAYVAFVGPIQKGMLVLHKCDTRPCVNPQHLELGSHREKNRARTVKAMQTPERRAPLDLKGRIDRLSSRSSLSCVVWQGAVVNRTGYGEIKVDGRKISAHRAVWLAHRGEIPIGMVVMHACDNRLCVNLDHLSLGTRRDNMIDMSKKGRGGFNKLTTDQRREMGKRAAQTTGVEGFQKASAARLASTTPEQRSASCRKGWKALTPEQRSQRIANSKAGVMPGRSSEAAKEYWATMTPEQRSETVQKMKTAMTPEQKSEAAKKIWAARRAKYGRSGLKDSKENRLRLEKMSAFQTTRQAALTPEQRSDTARKVWAARRAKYGQIGHGRKKVEGEKLDDDLVPFVRHWTKSGHSVESITVAFNVTVGEIERAVA